MTAFRMLIATLALTLSASAFAQAPAAPAEPPKAPLATVYGTLNVNFQYAEASDATAGSASDISGRTAVSIDSSNIGVRGGLDVEHGLKVVYQCETQASIDGMDVRGLCNRNSRVGLQSNFGTLFYGNWDAPLKAAAYGTKADDPFGNTDVFGYQGIMGSPGFNTRSGAFTGGVQAGFDLRAANSIAYWSPKFSGVSFKVQYSADEARSVDGTVDPMLLGAAVNYDIGGLSVVAAGEYHEDAYGLRTITAANAGRTASKDMAWRLAAGYEVPLPVGALTFMGMLEQLSYKQEDAAAVGNSLEDYSRFAWLLGAKFRMGNHEFRARFAQALGPSCTTAGGADCTSAVTDELAATQYAAGYAYHLAKSTQVYAYYTQIMNNDLAQYTFTVGGAQTATGGNVFASTPAGADPTAVGVGIRYAF